MKTSILPASDVPHLFVEGFTAYKVTHGFFGRQGGISHGIYQGLNCGQGSTDEAQAVQQNRSSVAETIGVLPQHLLSLYQVHGADCIHVETPWDVHDRPKADAMITDRPGIGLGILTADCVPVLFNGGRVVAAAHAGWKGALGGVLDATIKAFGDYGVAASTINVCIGPSIAQRSYEVSTEFLKNFMDHDPENERFFREARQAAHYMFDLPAYCASRLQPLGLSQIFMSDIDTYENEQDFFSYRRATHRKEPDYGRQISVIAIND